MILRNTLYHISYKLELLLAILVISLSGSTLLAGIVVPVYSDEVAMLWTRGRVIAEGGNLVSLLPQCSESFVTTMPLLLWPGAVFYSAVFGNFSLFGIRLVGVCLGFAWFGGLAYLCSRFFQQRKDALTCFSAICAVSFLGVLPFVWVLARSEDVLILCLLVLTVMAIGSRPDSRLYVKSFVLVVASVLLFYVHPKGLFFLPFVVVAAFFILRRANSILKYCVLLVVASVAAQSVITWVLSTQCKEAPAVNMIFSIHAIPLSLLFDSPLSFFQKGMGNLLAMPNRVVIHLQFANAYQSGWLPPMQTSELTIVVNVLVKWIIKSLMVGAIFSGILKFFIGCYRRNITLSGWLAMALSVGLIANAFLYNAWNFYGAQQVISVAILIGLLVFADIQLPSRLLTVIRGLGVIIMATALVSLIVLNLKMVPELYRSATSEIYPPPNQPLSVPHLNQHQHFETIRALAKVCRIYANGAKNLVVDHMTYFAFSGLRQPIHIAYVSEYAFGGDLTNGRLVPFLKQLRSPGAIGSCTYMSPQFRSLPQAELNGYCCVVFDEGLRGDQVQQRGIGN